MSSFSDAGARGGWNSGWKSGRRRWKPVEIAALVLGFALWWPLGVAVLGLKFAQRRGLIGDDVLADTNQSGGGEDFSWYLEEVPGAMARLGVWSGRGPQLDLHQPTFDLDERALATGVRVLTNLVEHAADGPEG